jgi:lysophospholipase L1-like esterase
MALGPILLAQGAWARLNVPQLPEPPGERLGSAGRGPTLKLLVTGDSAAAGVGAGHQDEALLGQIVARLRDRYRVSWNLQARSGDTTADTLERLDQLEAQHFDVAVTSLGVNDVIRMTTRDDWRSRQAALWELLRKKFGVSTLIVSGLPPVHDFPALPQPLRWHIGSRATEFNADLAAAAEADGRVHFVDLRFEADISLAASDGFHPGPGVYALWGERVADIVLAT